MSIEAAQTSDPNVNDIFITRQPIYNQELIAVAYELIYQSLGDENSQIDYDDITSEVLINSLMEIGLPNISETKPAFFSVSPKYLSGELPFPLEQENVVLQVSAQFTGNDYNSAALKNLNTQDGFPLALEDFIFDAQNVELAKLANYVKIDISRLSHEEITQQIVLLKPLGIKLIAEKVATQSDFQLCKDYGFDLFQGYFFCEPNTIKGQRTPSSRMAILHLLAEVQKPDVSFSDLEKHISLDVSLSYRILRYINSALYNLPNKVESIRQAITILGLKAVKNWITIISQSKFDDKPYELMITSLVRGRMCELLAEALDIQHDSVFVVGLFSTLDALLDKPMNEVLAELPLTEEVNDAILNKQGLLGEILQCVIAYEQGDWEQIPNINLDNQIIKDTYLNAIQWTREVGQQILSTPA